MSLPDSTSVRQRPSERHDRCGVVVGQGFVEYAPESQGRFPISNDVDGVLDALDSGQLADGALDVLPQEPPPANHVILRHRRVLLTHAAFYSTEGEKELRRKAAQNLVDWARTGRLTYVVVEGK